MQDILSHDYDEMVTLFPEKICGCTPDTYHIRGVLISIICGEISIIMYMFLEHSTEYLWPNFLFASIPSLVISTVIFLSKLLERFTPSLIHIMSWPPLETVGWYSRELNKIFNQKKMFYSGLLFSLVFMPFIGMSSVYPLSSLYQIFFLFIVLCLYFSAGGFLYMLVQMLIFVKRIGATEAVNIAINQHPSASVLAIGRLMGKTALITLVLYLYGMSYIFVVEVSVVDVVSAIVFGLIVIFFFLWPQAKIHELMVKIKTTKLIDFSKHLEVALEQVTQNPNPKNIQRVRELFEIQLALKEMREWPFDVRMLLSVVTGIAIPIIVVVIQFAIQKFWSS